MKPPPGGSERAARPATACYPLLDRGRPVGSPAPLLPRLEAPRVHAIVVA